MKKILLTISLLLLAGAGCNYETNTVAIDTSSNKIEVENIQVSTFYDGSDGYSLSIPKGNESICLWTYSGGTGHVPYLDPTYAKTATEKHVLRFPDGKEFLYDFKVICSDDWGNRYIGTFPEDNQN